MWRRVKRTGMMGGGGLSGRGKSAQHCLPCKRWSGMGQDGKRRQAASQPAACLQGADGDDVHAADDDRQAAGAPLPLQLNRHLGRAG